MDHTLAAIISRSILRVFWCCGVSVFTGSMDCTIYTLHLAGHMHVLDCYACRSLCEGYLFFFFFA